MASITPKTESRLSFARVAASQGKENVALSYATMAATNLAQNANPTTSVAAAAAASNKTEESNSSPMTVKAESESKAESATEEEKLAEALRTVALTPSLIVNGSGTASSESTGIFGNGSPHEMFGRADSLSDLGTKPPSLDGKSITSGTTFALDEKESLRPDDSASVKAAEDDDTFSGRGSIVAGSRIGSEAAARAYRAQVYEVSERKTMVIPLEAQQGGFITPQSGSSGPNLAGGQPPPKPMSGALPLQDGSFNIFYKKTPDDKLIEAMESPKDRIFLLRLEQDVISFVKETKDPFFDVPPSNSFCRMLTHKLADYYHLTHQFDPLAGSVRIFRTPFCRLPESLSSVSNPPTTGNTPPPVPTMKILRRGGDNGSPSKPSSENGGDGQDKSKAAKERMSREEKEAHYHAARERIFGQADKSGEQTPDTEDGNGMSRSSSVSGKAKPPKTRRKQHRNDSEPFDVRSAYQPIYPSEPQQFAPWQSAPVLQQQFPGVTIYGGQGKGYPTPPLAGYVPQIPQMAQQAYGAMNQQYGQGIGLPYQNQSPLSQSYGSPVQSPPQQTPIGPWTAPGYQPQAQMQQQMPQQMQLPHQYTPRAASIPGQTIPYPYGQLPSTINPQDPKSQHPIPGSFNRHAFNPKTQSFVPGSGLRGGELQQPIGSNHSSPHMQQFNMYQAPQPQFMGYNMSRQSSNTSVPSSYHASPHLAQRPTMHMMSQSPMQNQMPMQGQMGMQCQLQGQMPMQSSMAMQNQMQCQMQGGMQMGPMMNPQAQPMMQGQVMGQSPQQMMASPPNQGMMQQPMMQSQQQMGQGPNGQYFGLGYMPTGGRPQ